MMARGTRDKRVALEKGWVPAGAPSHEAQQEGTSAGGFGRAGCAAGSNGRLRKTCRGDGVFT